MNYKKTLILALVCSIALSISTIAAVDTSKPEFSTTLTVDGSGYSAAEYVTIQAAVNAAHAGDVIEVKGGTYPESVKVDKTLMLIGVKRDGRAPIINADGFNSAIILNADGCTVEEFRIIGATDAGITVNSDNNVITDNVILGNALGIWLKGNGNWIFNNYFENAKNAEDQGSNNFWNASREEGVNIVGNPFIGGNYWSEYAGRDGDGDGIGDIPHHGDVLPLVLAKATVVDMDTHESHPPPEEVAPTPYEVAVDTEELETRLTKPIAQQEKIIDEPTVTVMAPPLHITEEEVLVEQLREAKTTGDMEAAMRIEEELARIRCEELATASPAPPDVPLMRAGLVTGGESDIPKWSPGDILVAGENYSEINPSIASDEEGNLYVAVEDGADDNFTRIYRSTNGGQSWYYWYWTWVGSGMDNPSLTIGDGGGMHNRWLHMALATNDGWIGVFRVNLSNPSPWEFKWIEHNSPGVSNPSIVTDSAEYSGWYSYLIYNARAVDNWVLRFSRSFDYGGNWTDPVTVTGYCGYPDEFYNAQTAHPDIDYGSYNLYVAFDNYPPPCTTTTRDIFVMNSTNFGVSWSSAVRLTTSADDEYDPSVAAVKGYTTNKTAVVAYTRYYTSLHRDVRYAYTRNGGSTWSTNWCLACTADNEKSPDLTTSLNKGALHAAYWHDYDIDFKSAGYLTPTSWAGLQGINSGNAASSVYSRPTITVNPEKPLKDEAGIAWTDMRNAGMGYDIYFDAPQLPGEGGCYDYNLSAWITPPVSGNWNVYHDIECNCTSIKLNGDLNIAPGGYGSLRFNDVLLQMNCTDNGEYGINVYDNGAFYVSDLNSAPSVITNGDVSNAYYTFRVNDGSTFKLLGSEVNNAGYAWNLDTAGDNYNSAGLWINTDKTIIDRSTIRNNHFVGIIFYESNKHQVTNSHIYGNDWDGIFASSSSDNYFANNQIYTNGDDGVDARSCPNNHFEGNLIRSNGDDGIVLSSSVNSLIGTCEIASNGDAGITASSSNNLKITDNDIYGNNVQDEGIVLSSSSDCNIARNNLDRNRWFGIHLSSSPKNTLDNNTVTHSTAEAGSAGIYLSESLDNTITKNVANWNLRGIQLWQSGHANVTNNLANGNSGSGISLENSDDSDVKENTAINNGAGISVSYTDHTNLSNNHARNNTYGVSLSGSTYNNLTINTLDSNKNYNLHLFGSSYNNITTNNMDKSGSIGAYLEDSHSNELVNNTARLSGNYGIDLFNSNHNKLIMNNVTGSTNIGIGLSSSDDTEILKNTAEECAIGVSMRWSDGNNVATNDANENDIGMYMFQSHKNTVLNNDFSGNANNGLELSVSNNNVIDHNRASGNQNYGIHAYSSMNNDFITSTVNSNGVGIYLDWSAMNHIERNQVTHNSMNGITLDWSSNENQVINNDVETNGNISIQISHSSKNLLQDNDATNSAIGIFLDWSADNKIIHNDASHNLYHGITLEWFSDNNSVVKNTAVDNIVGTSLQWSSNNSIGSNNAGNNNVSINLEWSSSNNEIIDNLLSNNSYYGISLSWKSNNTRINANTVNNSRIGLRFDDTSMGNTVYDNTLCGNSIYDIDDDNSNIGDNNRCDLTDNWNDIGTTGCTDDCGAGVPQQCGDANGDGKVDFLGDVIGVARHYMYGDPINCAWCADVDCDGDIDFLGDAIKIARHYMYGEALSCCPS